jgi:hypothetical protein
MPVQAKLPVCSARRQRPGRRTSICPDGGPRVREGHGRHRLPRGVSGARGLGAAAYRANRGSPGAMPGGRGRSDWCAAESGAPEKSATAGLWLLSTQFVSATGGACQVLGTVVLCDRLVFVTDLGFSRRWLPMPTGSDLCSFSAPPQYGRLPHLATAKERRKREKLGLAHSPNVQRVLYCSSFARGHC